MKQTRRGAGAESLIHVGIGFSLVRGYLVRRWVDARLHRKKNK
jgi:hypothetical protein